MVFSLHTNKRTLVSSRFLSDYPIARQDIGTHHVRMSHTERIAKVFALFEGGCQAEPVDLVLDTLDDNNGNYAEYHHELYKNNK